MALKPAENLDLFAAYKQRRADPLLSQGAMYRRGSTRLRPAAAPGGPVPAPAV